MTEKEKKISSDQSDSKAKFREALEKKKLERNVQNKNITGGSKISGGQSGGNTPKMFRRKSGSA